MPSVDDLFPGKYLKAADVLKEGGRMLLTISDVRHERMEDREGNEESKPVVYFKEIDRGLVLNKTNARRIQRLTGENMTEEWVGHEIPLIAPEEEAFGEWKPVLRVDPNGIQQHAPTMMEQYGKLYNEAKEAGVPNIQGFLVEPNASEKEIEAKSIALKEVLDEHNRQKEDGEDDLPFDGGRV